MILRKKRIVKRNQACCNPFVPTQDKEIVFIRCKASLAQWIEHWSRKPGVVSSILTGGKIFFLA